MVDSSLVSGRVIGVVVENHSAARPQSGLNEASMVFETFAEGGITRFLALFQEGRPKEIGPVRSARPYFVDWTNGVDGLFSHVGGSVDGLDLIKKLRIDDLNQFSLGSYYWRDKTRYAPHNVYTTVDKLYAAAKSKGYEVAGSADIKYSFKEDASLANRPAAQKFNVGFNRNYGVTYEYQTKSNDYARIILGKYQTDRITKQKIVAKNVVVCFSDFSFGKYSSGLQRITARTTGTGKTVYYQDGVKKSGSWSRAGSSSQIVFKDDKGMVVKLNRGTTWVDFVPVGTAVK